MTPTHAPTSWGATVLGAVSVALALVAAAPLLVGATFGARSSRGDVLWAMLSAAPEVVVVALGVWVVFAARRPTPSSREVGARALAGGLLLAVPCLVGGAWAMLLTAGNDAKWLALAAGALGAFAAVLLAAGGAVLKRHA